MSENPPTRYARSGDLDIAYQVLGDSALDVVVVPPGLTVMDTAWDDDGLSGFWRRIASFSRLLLLDKRGTGFSDRVQGVPTLEERMDDVRAVMDAVGIEQAALIAGSEAGPISSLFAATYPERVKALVLIGAVVKWSASPDFPWGYSEEVHNFQLDYVTRFWGSGRSGELWFAPSLAEDAGARDWVARTECATGTPSAMATLLAMNALIDVRPVLGTVSAPTLVIHRANERVVDVHHGRYYAEHITGAKYVELPGEDHWWWVGDSGTILDEIEEFLTGHREEREPDRVLKTLLFTDIVDSTRRASQLGDAAWHKLLDEHDRIARRHLDHFRGREVKTTGDGLLATFDGPARAIKCACAIRDGIRVLGLQLRAGLHTGEVEVRGDDIAGIAVHFAQRVQSSAEPNGVLVSSTVRDLVAGSGIDFEDGGEHELKGVPGTWKLFAVKG